MVDAAETEEGRVTGTIMSLPNHINSNMWDNHDFCKNSILIKSTDLIAPSARVVQALELASSEIITDDEVSYGKILSTLQSLKSEDKARHSCARNKFIIIEKDDFAKLC